MPRPLSLNVFGLLNIAFGALRIFGIFGTTAFLSGSMGNNPAMKIMLENIAYVRWVKWTVPLNLASGLILVAAGIGLLRLMPWARTLSLGWAAYEIVFCIVSMVVFFAFVFRPMMEAAHQLEGPEAAGAIGGAFAPALGIIYPILLTVFMTRRKVIAAFSPTTPPPLPHN